MRAVFERHPKIFNPFQRPLRKPELDEPLGVLACANPSTTRRTFRPLTPLGNTGSNGNWAAKRALVKAAFDLEKPHADVEEETGVGQRVLTHDELRAVLPHLNDPHGRC
jgi:hypothetical protein